MNIKFHKRMNIILYRIRIKAQLCWHNFGQTFLLCCPDFLFFFLKKKKYEAITSYVVFFLLSPIVLHQELRTLCYMSKLRLYLPFFFFLEVVHETFIILLLYLSSTAHHHHLSISKNKLKELRLSNI
jgi:hypothetical protein